MDKSKSSKKAARIYMTDQMTAGALKALSKEKSKAKLESGQMGQTYHDLTIEEAASRDLRTSSNSSLSLSFFSESDLAEAAPSTSGCSSEMASTMQSKERRKEKAKEFMKKLKSMLPGREKRVKMDTLSTLEQVVNNMKRLSEGQSQRTDRTDGEFKMPHAYPETYHSVEADKLLQSEMFISVSVKNHIIQSASPALMTHLGYPPDWWKGRLFKDFLFKNDINAVNGYLAQHSEEEHELIKTSVDEKSPALSNMTDIKGSKYFFARIRRFRKLAAGFSIQGVVSYSPFILTVLTCKTGETSAAEEDKEGNIRLKISLGLYCRPLVSAYTDAEKLPSERHFSLRHSSNCKYTNTDPRAVPLLGFLPQDLNEMSIFDLYHPDDYQKLLEIYKKIIKSMGQRFKTDGVRLKTHNGCYVELETEWSSFVNPWSMRMEFIIGQHTVTKCPSRLDVFEDDQSKKSTDTRETKPEERKVQEKILEVLQQPIQDVFTQPAPRAPVKDQGQKQVIQGDDSSTKLVKENAKINFPVQDVGEKYTVLDEKGISSVYNQLNYSHTIKKFLLSHPKPTTHTLDEDGSRARDDGEYDPMHADEEMPLEIPVVKPSSCGSSTQVHVSEQGNGEELLTPPVFGDEAMVVVPSKEVPADNIGNLTEDSLKKHTKFQELLYLQKIAEEQPLLLNMRRRTKNQIVPQKRPWISGPDEEVDKAKHPCTISGIFRSSSNIFMQSFPSISSCTLTPTTYSPGPMFSQSNLMVPINSQGQLGVMLNQPPGLFSALPLAPPPQFTLMDVRQAVNPMTPVTPLTSMPPASQQMSSVPIATPESAGNGQQLAQGIQWPYYPQPGYTLLPQVMGGFYQSILQPISVDTAPSVEKIDPAAAQKESGFDRSTNKNKSDTAQVETENVTSSGDDTGSSIMFLLESGSSTLEEFDKKMQPRQGLIKGEKNSQVHLKRQKRCAEPLWLQGVKWNNNVKLRYQMPQAQLKPVLKKDEKFLKKLQQESLALENLEQLLEDITMVNPMQVFDEEMDDLFFPDDRTDTENQHLMEDKFMEMEMTKSSLEDDEERKGEDKGGGEGGGGGGREKCSEEIIWEVDESEPSKGEQVPVSEIQIEKITVQPAAPSTTDKEEEKEQVILSEKVDATDNSDRPSGMEVTAPVFLPSPETDLDKSSSSPKEGSLSGDEGSESANNKETEDSQSNCSKLSSDVTPSDDRSNEEAGSSLKESNGSDQHVKLRSPSSSLGLGSVGEDDEEGMDTADFNDQWESMYKTLFVPLKVLACPKPSKGPQPLPFWLAEAQMSRKVSMTYKLPKQSLEEILKADAERMKDVCQSATTKHQLHQLLAETCTTSGTLTGSKSLSESSFKKSYSDPLMDTTSHETAQPCCQEESHKTAMDTAMKINIDEIITTTHDKGKGSCATTSANQHCNDSSFDEIKSCLPNNDDMLTEKTVPSDSNSDPVVGDSFVDSSASTSSSSLSNKQLHSSSSLPVSSKTPNSKLEIDTAFKDCFPAFDSEHPSQSGLSIEDVITNNVFVNLSRTLSSVPNEPE